LAARNGQDGRMSALAKPEPLAPPEAAPVMACTVHYFDRTIAVPPQALTHAGFRAWAVSDDFPERGRISFFEQEVVIDMSPEEFETHVKVKEAVSRGIAQLNRQLELGEFYSDGAFVTNEAARLSTEPDATFVSWEGFESGRVRLVPREGFPGEFMELVGSPDCVLEVVSRTSFRKDTIRLRRLYHLAGVREYWLINALDEEIDFQVLVHHPDDYEPAPVRGRWRMSAVFGRGFYLERRRNRLGRWTYTLRVKKFPESRRR
jgi:Uma2 family endonuclease